MVVNYNRYVKVFLLILQGRVDETDRSCIILGEFISSTPLISKKILHILLGALRFDLLDVGLKILGSIISNDPVGY